MKCHFISYSFSAKFETWVAFNQFASEAVMQRFYPLIIGGFLNTYSDFRVCGPGDLSTPHAWRAMPCHAMPCHAMPCHAMPCHAMPCHAMLPMPCHAMPCHAMPCHACLPVAPDYTRNCFSESMGSRFSGPGQKELQAMNEFTLFVDFCLIHLSKTCSFDIPAKNL